jgi:hypothetical protein
MKTLAVAVLAVALLWSRPSSAQEKPGLEVIIEDLNEHATPCGISKLSMESVASLTLRNNGIRVAHQFTNPHLYLLATPMAMVTKGDKPVGCAAFLRVSVRGYLTESALPSLGGFRARSLPLVELCSSGLLLTGPESTFGTRFTDALERQVKSCLGQLEY